MDPIGDWRQEFAMAHMCSLITNLAIQIHGDKEKAIALTKPFEFMPDWDHSGKYVPDVKRQSIEDMKQAMISIANSQNKKKKVGNKIRKPKKLIGRGK